MGREKPKRVKIEHLNALLHAIDVMQDAVFAGAEDTEFIRDAELCSEARDWVMSEIIRRKNRKMIRAAVKSANQILQNHYGRRS